MRVYLWVAGSSEGVTDDQDQARRLAARFLLENGAAQAVVEPAVLDLSSLDRGLRADSRTTMDRQPAGQPGRLG